MKTVYFFAIIFTISYLSFSCTKEDIEDNIVAQEQEEENEEEEIDTLTTAIIGKWLLVSICVYDYTNNTIHITTNTDTNITTYSTTNKELINTIYNDSTTLKETYCTFAPNHEVVICEDDSIYNKFWNIEMQILSLGNEKDSLSPSYQIELTSDTELKLSFYDLTATTTGGSYKLKSYKFKKIKN